ncbi:MAG: nodulation protein NfeD [Calditrichaceae bacterium]|nr:nodulation protein NfeD [Calditrichaceae bacterium]
MKKILLLQIIFLFIISSAYAKIVHRIVINGVINPVATEYIIKSIEKAERENVELLLVELDTPGGLMESMHQIMKAIQSSDVPVAVYVAPSGSRAGSAGVYITYSAHIAAMAPSTNIGSAHPVFGSGSGEKMDSTTTETMMEKVVNDAVAKIKAVAKTRGRNVEWAEKAVRESANITETEALKLNVIEYIVPSADSLLSVLDGKEIKLDTGVSKQLNTRNATVITYEMSWRQRMLDTITNPNIAYILMMIGMAGIMLEIYNPGSILPGVAGGVSLIIALYAMQTLPVNYVGLLLIIFAIILFLLEIKIPSFGLLTIGGIISMVIGSIMLFDSDLPFLRLAWEVIAVVVTITTLFFIFVIGMAVHTHRKRPTTGQEGMLGEIGEVYKKLDPYGTVIIHGEYWKAFSDSNINKGQKVKVIECDNKHLTIKVEAI